MSVTRSKAAGVACWCLNLCHFSGVRVEKRDQGSFGFALSCPNNSLRSYRWTMKAHLSSLTCVAEEFGYLFIIVLELILQEHPVLVAMSHTLSSHLLTFFHQCS